MSRMSHLDIDVRQAEADGVDFFPTQIYADPVNSDRRVWAIFDVQEAKASEHRIAFVRGADGQPLTFGHDVIEAYAWITNRVGR